MKKGCHWDEKRGMTMIDKSPEVLRRYTPEQIKQWMATGRMPKPDEDEDEEPCNCEACQAETEDLNGQDE